MKAVLIAGALVVGAVMVAAPASAVAWGSASTPLIASGHGRAYGTFVNSGPNIYARTNSTYKDDAPGNGHSVYVTTDYGFLDSFTRLYFTQYSNVETPRTASASYVFNFTQKPLNDQSNSAVGHTNICEDQSFSGDPCSSQTHPKFNY